MTRSEELTVLRRLAGALVVTVALLPGGAGAQVDLRTPEIERALAIIQPGPIAGHIRFLADDLLEGRATGTRGYDIAAGYVASQFQALGLLPAGDDGTWFQRVPLRTATLSSRSLSLVRRDGSRVELVPDVDFSMSGDVVADESFVDAPVVFVGFGVRAPELKHDDFAGLDLKGKIVATLTGAPSTFPHSQRAHYSNSNTKYAEFTARGAVGVIAIRTPSDERRSTWERSVRQSKFPNMRSIDPAGNLVDAWPQLKAAATLNRSGSQALFQAAPQSLDSVFAKAERGVAPRFALPVTARLERHSARREISSSNVVARLQGSDPALAEEIVVFSSHLDHLGIGVPVDGDSINNGAFDNASGIASMIEMARAFVAGPRPRRSLLFIALCGEEKGLIGASHFAAQPTVPGDKIVANVNVDMIVAIAPIRDIVAYGAEHSSLGGVARRAAERMNLALTPDPRPEEVIFVRSDQYAFIKRGIPALFLVRGQGGEGVADRLTAWLRTIYHSPQDDLRQSIDHDALVTFSRTAWLVGHIVAQETERPAWNAGDFFGRTFGRSRTARRLP